MLLISRIFLTPTGIQPALKCTKVASIFQSDSQSMALSSMTGFARGQGVAGTYAWAWELKSVNSKGFDLKLRLPPGWDAIEAGADRKSTRLNSSH